MDRIYELFNQILYGWKKVVTNYLQRRESIEIYALGVGGKAHATLITITSFIFWYLAELAGALSILYFILAIYAVGKRLVLISRNDWAIVISYIMINLMITCTILLQYMFLSKRYLLGLALILMLFVPFVFEYYFNHLKKHKMIFGLLLLTTLISGMTGIYSLGYSKKYVHEAGEWLAENTHGNKSIFSNDIQVLYYSKLFDNQIFKKYRDELDIRILQGKKWEHYDYLALHINANDQETQSWLPNEIPMSPIKVFANARGDKIAIYKKRKNHPY